jgi:hypothetical protein
MSMNYNFDREVLRHGAVTDPNLRFAAARRAEVQPFAPVS